MMLPRMHGFRTFAREDGYYPVAVLYFLCCLVYISLSIYVVFLCVIMLDSTLFIVVPNRGSGLSASYYVCNVIGV